MIETPWGLREIYDPAEDTDVKKAALWLFQNGSFTFGDISQYSGTSQSSKPSNRNVKIMREARLIHELDYLRLGCEYVSRVPCSGYGSINFSNVCDWQHSLGSSDLSSCEEENIRTNLEILSWPKLKIKQSDYWLMKFSNQEEKLGYYSLLSNDCKVQDQVFNFNHRTYFNKHSGNFDKLFNAATMMECRMWTTKK